MKISKLLVLSALWLVSLGASAIDVTERQAPEKPNNTYDEEALGKLDKTPQDFTADQYYVLYNKGAMKYFIAGNDWSTRASVNDKEAAVVYFTQTAAAKEKGEGVYELKNYVPNKNEFRSAFAGGVDDFWTDNNGRADRFWKVTMNGTDLRFSNVVSEPTLFAGWSQPKNDTRLYLLDANADGAFVDWQLFLAPGWKEYEDSMVIYNKAEELLNTIKKAEEVGISVESELILEAVEVYENLNSTIEQMEAQIQVLKKEIANAMIEWADASAGEPVDVTALMENYDYEGGTNQGWSGDAPAVNSTSLNAEFFNKNYNYYQTVKGAHAGVYAVTVQAYYRAGEVDASYKNFQVNTNRNAKLMAEADGTEVLFPIVNVFAGATADDLGLGDATANINEEIYVPNTMAAAQTYFDETQNPDGFDKYYNTLYFALNEGDMKVGLKKTKQLGNDWTLWDNWNLQYFGNGVDAYQMMFDKTKETYVEQMPADDYTVTTAYTEAFEAISPATVDKVGVSAALIAMEAAYDTITVNAQLWLDLAEVAEKAKAIAADENLDEAYTGPLGTWGNMTFTQLKMQKTLTNEEIRALIAQKTEEITEAGKHPAQGASEIDMTSMLTNPDFATNDWTGWTKEAASGGNVVVSQSCAEAWNNAGFDIYQVVKNAPTGVYKIKVQGFYRYGRGTAWNDWKAQTSQYVKSSPCFVYMNDVATPFMNIFAEEITDNSIFGSHTGYSTYEGGTYYAPNDMTTAADCFATESQVNQGENMFTQEAMGLVAFGDDMRVGVKGVSNQLGDSWVIFDNFKLIYVGYEPSVIQPLLEEQVIKYTDRLAENMSKTAYDSIQSKLAAAQDAIEKADGEKMFTILGDLLALDAYVSASVAKFGTLATALENLNEAISQYEATAFEDAVTAAKTLASTIDEILPAHSIEDADIEGYIEQINGAIAALRVPNPNGQGSDAEAFDMTSAINNPAYDESGDGWSGTAAARDNDNAIAEIFNTDYNYYQDLKGLPAGTYEIKLQGFYRYGLADQDYLTLEDPLASKAFLYGMTINGEDSVYSTKPLVRLCSQATDWIAEAPATDYTWCATDTIIDTEAEPADTTVYYKHVANRLSTAAGEFSDQKYTDNSVIVKVPENGMLRIGLLKKDKMASDWTCFDNWQLLYYGTESQKTADGDGMTTGISIATVAANRTVEFYTLDGRRLNAAQKGINILKITKADGTVVVKKVRR